MQLCNVLVSANPRAPTFWKQRGEERSRGVELEVAGEIVFGRRLTDNFGRIFPGEPRTGLLKIGYTF